MSRPAVTTRASEPAVSYQDLGIQDGGAGGTSDGVVPERLELPVKDRTGAKAPARDAHAPFAIGVEARLRAVVLGADRDRLPRRAPEIEPPDRTAGTDSLRDLPPRSGAPRPHS